MSTKHQPKVMSTQRRMKCKLKMRRPVEYWELRHVYALDKLTLSPDDASRIGRLDANEGQRGGQRVHHISCTRTFGMMRAAFGPVIPATSRMTVMLVYAEETPSDFAREVPEGIVSLHDMR